MRVHLKLVCCVVAWFSLTVAGASDSASNSTSNSTNSCVPINECQPIRDLWNNRHSLPGKTESDVKRFIRSKSCGGRKRVLCPNILPDEEVPDDYYEGLSIYWPPSEPVCSGSLKFYTIKVSTFAFLRPICVRWDISNFYHHMEDRYVLRAVVEGNCCWILSSQRMFRGRWQILGLGVATHLEVVPRSISMIPCPMFK